MKYIAFYVSILCLIGLIVFAACSVDPEDSTSTTTTTTIANLAPTAEAGTNQWVNAGVTVTLTGSATDPESDDLTYAWTQDASNPAVVALTGDDSNTVSFTTADKVGIYDYILTVTDSFGNSISDSVTVSVFEKKIIASDGAIDDNFGYSVSISEDGTTMLIGVYFDDDNGDDSGSAYIYKWDGTSWAETKLTASDGAIYDRFGNSVSISADGTTAVIGAYQDNDNDANSGSAYIYQWDGTSWAETKLTASDGAASDAFGISVSVSGDGETALIGAYQDDDDGNSSGAAYIYQWNGTSWVETKLTASDGAADEWFGNSVSMSGDGETAVVGAIYNHDNGFYSGSAYIYKWNGTSWVETLLLASDGDVNDRLGNSVYISADGETAIVGGYFQSNENGDYSGSAYIYKWNGTSWVETKLTSSDGAADDIFGISVSISADGETAIVGAECDDDNGIDSGSAYIYKWDGSAWNETKLTASDGAASDNLGKFASLSADGTTALIGAIFDDDNGSASGSAYIFSVDAAMSMP